MHIQGAILIMLFILAACSGGGSDGTNNTQPPAPETATVLAANDLGMHCMDREFSVFSILPPFNVVNAQVVLRDGNGRPYVADDAEVEVFYDDNVPQLQFVASEVKTALHNRRCIQLLCQICRRVLMLVGWIRVLGRC